MRKLVKATAALVAAASVFAAVAPAAAHVADDYRNYRAF